MVSAPVFLKFSLPLLPPACFKLFAALPLPTVLALLIALALFAVLVVLAMFLPEFRALPVTFAPLIVLALPTGLAALPAFPFLPLPFFGLLLLLLPPDLLLLFVFRYGFYYLFRTDS